MTKKKWQLTAIASAVCIVALGIGAFCYWQFRLKPWFVFEKTRYGNMCQIAAGIGNFATDNKRIPISLAEVVQNGYLPEQSPIYRCPLLHNSLRDKPIPYVECEFDIRLEPNEAVVSLPRSVFDRFDFNATPAYIVEWRVDKTGNFVSP